MTPETMQLLFFVMQGLSTIVMLLIGVMISIARGELKKNTEKVDQLQREVLTGYTPIGDYRALRERVHVIGNDVVALKTLRQVEAARQ